MMGEYEPRDSRNVTGTASTPDGRWSKDGARPPEGVPNPSPPGRKRQQDDLPPEARNNEQDDEDAQAQTVAEDAAEEGIPQSRKVKTGREDDDVQDLVDRMRQMDRSGRIDYDAYRGERNDDDEEGMFGPGAED